jgi:hypothetical protein
MILSMAGGPPLRSVQSWDHRHQRAPFLLAAVRFTYLGSISVSATTYSYSGKHCAISDPSLLTFPIAIAQYSIIAYMQPHPDPVKSLQFKILAINPYYSEILMLSRLQVHCFHRPEGEGGTLNAIGSRATWQHGGTPRGTRMTWSWQSDEGSTQKEQGSTLVLPRSRLFYSVPRFAALWALTWEAPLTCSNRSTSFPLAKSRH